MKSAILVLLLFVGYSYASAQEVYTSSGKPGYQKKIKKKKKGFDRDKMIFGGVPTLGFGGGVVDVGVSGIAGYRITDHFSAGIGLGYQYYQQPDIYSPAGATYYDKESIIVPNIWSRYFVWRGLYVTGQFEYDFIKETYPLDNYGLPNATVSRYGVPCLLIGPGIREPLGGRLSLFVELMVDVLQQPNSPYLGSPVFHGGVCVGL